MKLNKLSVTMIAAGVLLLGSISFYKVYGDAVAEVKEDFVSSMIVDAAEQSVLTKDELLKATNVSENPQIKDVEITEKDFMKNLTPGIYQVEMTITTNFNQILHKTVTVQVVDRKGPTITVAEKLQMTQGETLDQSAITAIDQVSGKVPAEKIEIKDLDPEKIGEQLVTIVAADRAGNLSEKQVPVEVVPPVEEPTVAASEAASAEGQTTEEVAVENQEVATPVTSEVSASQPAAAAPAETTPAAPPAAAATPAPAAAPAPVVTTSVLQFAGVTVPFGYANGASSAPGSGAATWMGTGSTTDGAPTHFIGHNPGDFAAVMGLGVGSVITVTDSNGNSRSYTVYEIIDVTDDGYNNRNLADDVYPRMLYAGGERISLQTCITETVNRCVLAA